jgi:hypothetical protein
MDPTTKVEIDEENGIIRIALEGRHSPRTIVAAVSSIADRPRMHRLWDLTGADFSALDFEAIALMTKDITSLPRVDPNVRVAIVAARDVDFGLARMFETLREGETPAVIRVFRTREDAEVWLAEMAAN